MAYVQVIDHMCMDPQGTVSRNKGQRLSTASKGDRQRARTRSHIATSRLKRKLAQHRIVQADDSSWHVLRGDELVARFEDVTDAVRSIQ